MSGECDTCRHRNVPFDVDPCRSCIRHRTDGGDGWEPVEPPAPVPLDDAAALVQSFQPLQEAFNAQSRASSTHGPVKPPASGCPADGAGPCYVGFPDARPEPPAGVKLDGEKTRWDLLPWPALELVAQALTLGAAKYPEPENWRRVPDARRRYFAAAIRHAVAWLRGEKLDPESGLPHLAHLVCNSLFLLSFDLGETGGPAALEEPKP